jgi:multiple sugar transport system ATP-binding protein
VAEMARMLGLDELMARKPAALSGGQRQRVAIGRALVREPRAFLLDEPLSNLDAKLRTSMRGELARLHERLRVTTVYVTHDQIEAMTLGERVAVLRDGVIQQCDHPQVLYRSPCNLFVAAFIGSPAMNFVEAELVEQDGALAARFGPHVLRVPDGPLRAQAGRRVALGIRPEDIGDGSDGDALEVTVDIREDMGPEVFLHFAVDAPPVVTEELKEIVGDEALAAVDVQTHHHCSLFVARVARESEAREGGTARLRVDTRRLHFFDLETGRAL